MNRILILLGLYFVLFVKVNAQTSTPTKKELMEYLRTKLLAYNNENSTYYAYKDIIIDSDNCTMTFVYKSNEKQIVYFGNLDASTLKHDEYGYGEARFSISSVSGKTARVWFNSNGEIDPSANISRFFYDKYRLLKDGNPDLARIEKTLKVLILACGGKETKELF